MFSSEGNSGGLPFLSSRWQPEQFCRYSVEPVIASAPTRRGTKRRDPRHLSRIDVQNAGFGIPSRAAPFSSSIEARENHRAFEDWAELNCGPLLSLPNCSRTAA